MLSDILPLIVKLLNAFPAPKEASKPTPAAPAVKNNEEGEQPAGILIKTPAGSRQVRKTGSEEGILPKAERGNLPPGIQDAPILLPLPLTRTSRNQKGI